MEPNKPILPVYTIRFIVPRDSKIKNIEIEKSSVIESDVEIPVYRSEYYKEENVSGIYPNKEYWKLEREFLDGRKEIIFSVPIRYNPSRKEVIINSFSFKLIYDTDIEITDFYAIPTIEGETQIFYVVVDSSRPRKADVFLRVNGIEIQRHVNLSKGENKIELLWNATKSGRYKAVVVLISNETSIGPREIEFEILEKPNIFVKSYEKMIQVWKDLIHKFSRIFTSEKIEINKTYSDFKFVSWIENGNEIKRFESSEFKLTINESSEEKITTFITSDGILIIKEKLGSKEEIIKGSKDIKKKYLQTLSLIKEKLK